MLGKTILESVQEAGRELGNEVFQVALVRAVAARAKAVQVLASDEL
jgi:hypothetical protein